MTEKEVVTSKVALTHCRELHKVLDTADPAHGGQYKYSMSGGCLKAPDTVHTQMGVRHQDTKRQTIPW